MVETLKLLQFGDSVFPVGAFSFSNGLEMAVQHGVVHDRSTLQDFVRTVTRLAATGDGVALLAGHRAATAGDLDRIRQADEAVNLRKINEEMRVMSVRMGRKLAEASTRIVGETLLKKRIGESANGVPVTYPVALGVVFADLGVTEQDAFAAHQYGTASTVLGAAIRLMRVDHLDAQSILFAVNEKVADDYREVRTANLDDMQTFGPHLDVLAAAHQHVHVRMFMS
ncbi:urease accessory protein UreF [Micromonospora peucetia]|uniref:Urease accessory protein UreF n=1 Tax=Micromonospora peucetia TaxID=47871 RepID=A0A1C6W3C7_9ACTN|nr:urease accessory protein UreF [Micromonospora peucetia]MCX4390463.1 urease accessory protein UreF [Micromonospora peucetia]SCL73099.1 urease accessory protein [Micromonospora peucetia]